MDIVKYKLKGHESFALRDGWLTKGMRAVAADNRFYTVNSGTDILGVGTNMAKSIRYWLKAVGFTKENPGKGITFTDIGDVVHSCDAYMEDLFTLWIAHCNIATNSELATSWYLFFNYMNLTSAFRREEIQELMKTRFIEHTGVQEPSERSIRDDCAVILSMYCKSGNISDDPEEKKISPFEELGLISKIGNKYKKMRPSREILDELVVLYLMIDKLNDEGSIQIDYLTDGVNMPGKILNLNRIAINDYLDMLQNHGHIVVNRTAGLDIIYPKDCKGKTQYDVVRNYYGRYRR